MAEKVVSTAVERACGTNETHGDGGNSAVSRPVNLIGHVASLPIEVADIARLERAKNKVMNTKIHANILKATYHQVHRPTLIDWTPRYPCS